MNRNRKVQRYLDLVYRYKDDVYRIIFNVVEEHYTAEEMTQNVLENAWKGFDQLREPDKSKSWINTITKNEICAFMKEKTEYLQMLDYTDVDAIYDSHNVQKKEQDILEIIVRREKISMIIKSVECLDEKYRYILRPRLFGNITLKEIAEIYGMNYGTVRVYYSRGVDLLREAYDKLEKGGTING